MTAVPPPQEIDARKRALRHEVAEGLRRLSAVEHAQAGAAAGAALARWITHHAGPGPVALFAARPSEIDTHVLDEALRAAGRVRLLPAMRGDSLSFHAVPAEVAARDLPRDRFDIPTPPPGAPAVPLAAAALVIVPACAVDRGGHRLGWGRGFYDRALSSRRQGGCARGTVALIHDLQLVDEVPTALGDVAVERLCTPSRGLFDAVP